MKITLELFEDCCDFTAEKELEAMTRGEGNALAWQLLIDGKKLGELETYPNIVKKLDVIFDLEEIISKK